MRMGMGMVGNFVDTVDFCKGRLHEFQDTQLVTSHNIRQSESDLEMDDTSDCIELYILTDR
jgi:hypothetical protein